MSRDDELSGIPSAERAVERRMEEEVAFWREFIAWWEAKEGRRADARILDALHHSERRLAEWRARLRLSSGEPVDPPASARRCEVIDLQAVRARRRSSA